MRVNEFRQPQEELYEEKDLDAVLDIAIQGDAAWSKPMSAEQAIAFTLGINNNKEKDASKRKDM